MHPDRCAAETAHLSAVFEQGTAPCAIPTDPTLSTATER
jgi:hypothetical protein